MLKQAAQDIYNAAADKTGDHQVGDGAETTVSDLLGDSLTLAQSYRRRREFDKFDTWIAAVEQLTRLSQAERGVKQRPTR